MRGVLRARPRLGATSIALMNVSGRHGVEALKVYGEHVLPRQRE